jgi:hypothetical protein
VVEGGLFGLSAGLYLANKTAAGWVYTYVGNVGEVGPSDSWTLAEVNGDGFVDALAHTVDMRPTSPCPEFCPWSPAASPDQWGTTTRLNTWAGPTGSRDPPAAAGELSSAPTSSDYLPLLGASRGGGAPAGLPSDYLTILKSGVILSQEAKCCLERGDPLCPEETPPTCERDVPDQLRHQVSRLDLNGDGVADWIRAGAGDLQVALSTPGGFGAWQAIPGSQGLHPELVSLVSYDSEESGSCAISFMDSGPVETFADIDGDGTLDFVRTDGNGVVTVWRGDTSMPVGRPTLLSKVTSPSGAAYAVTYRSANEFGHGGAKPVVSQLQLTGAFNGAFIPTATTRYWYAPEETRTK